MSSPNNIKLFNNLKELINYCENCVNCKKKRFLRFSFGPDHLIQIDDLGIKASENNLELFTIINYEDELKPNIVSKLNVTININYLTNELTSEITGPKHIDYNFSKHLKSYYYFYINATCDNCNSYNTFSSDIEIDLYHEVIRNIGLEQENLYFNLNDHVLEIQKDFHHNELLITEYLKDNKEKCSIFPFIDLDFRDKEKFLEKINTILTFG